MRVIEIVCTYSCMKTLVQMELNMMRLLIVSIDDKITFLSDVSLDLLKARGLGVQLHEQSIHTSVKIII